MSPQTDPEKYLIARRIVAAAAQASGLHPAAILGHDRSKGAIYWRTAAMQAIRQATDASYPFIGHMFGARHHTTVMAALRLSTVSEQDIQKLSEGVV